MVVLESTLNTKQYANLMLDASIELQDIELSWMKLVCLQPSRWIGTFNV